MGSHDLEIRSSPANQASENLGTAAGHAAMFNSEAVIAGMFREKIAPGAFAKSLGGDVLALLDHDMGRVIGRSSSGTLRLKEDAKGLAVEIDLPDTPDGVTARQLLLRKDLRGMSFGFIVRAESWDDSNFGLPLRVLEEIELIEVSIVARPAYEDTTVGMRSLERHRSAASTRNGLLRNLLQRQISSRTQAREARTASPTTRASQALQPSPLPSAPLAASPAPASLPPMPARR